jgi:parallel beta-helix repeat protein
MEYVNVKTDEIFGEGVIVGNSTNPAVIDQDTTTMQTKLNLMALFEDPRILYFPWGHYRFNQKLSVGHRVRVHGQPMANQSSSDAGLNLPTVFDFVHTGTGIEVPGNYVEFKHIVFRGTAAQGDAIGCLDIGPGASPTSGSQSLVEWCYFFRPGGRASVRIRMGGGHFTHNTVGAHHNPAQWSYDPATLRPVRHHALWCPSLADHDISHNDLTGDGAGLSLDSAAGLNIHDNFIYNSNVGIYMGGTSRCSIADNRIEEHCREGVVIDWNTNGNSFVGNRVHNCGARTTEAAIDRVGLLLRSGEANVISGCVFDNWDHNVTQPGDLDFRSPQQYGLRVKAAEPQPWPTRPAPQYNLIGPNTFRNQKTANILNDGDETNKFVANVGRDFPGGVYEDSSPQPLAAGITTPAGVAAAAAGLIAFRNRTRSADALDGDTRR